MRLPSVPEPVHLVVGVLAAGLVAAAGVAVGMGAPPIDGSRPAQPDLVAPVVPVEPAGPAGTAPSATPATGPRAAPAWIAAEAAATGIPARALQSYADATVAIDASDPTCGLGWTTLAAIGAVESGHGTHGGTSLGADGRPGVTILGPALDGRPGFAAIRANPASALWTGDARWDHAVGPMQFLSSTWARWGADGDGDGVADPNDLDDAALAAGHYLCAAGVDLRTASGWTAAVRAYNHDDAYVASVLARADGYARAAR